MMAEPAHPRSSVGSIPWTLQIPMQLQLAVPYPRLRLAPRTVELPYRAFDVLVVTKLAAVAGLPAPEVWAYVAEL